jgi:DNA-binding NarL/FixJ family response regulator
VQAIRRVVEAAAPGLQRARLLPAFVEIMLAAGNADRARHASEELDAVARHHDSEALKAMAAHARGLVELADGKAQAALASLRIAFDAWQQVDAPYETARVRAAACLACGELGDSEGAELEMHAAQAAFRRLGAGPDLQRLAGLSGATTRDHPHGLTRREMQVLGHVASGKSNKAIAAELCLSERTVERHVSNIFDKLDVRSRAAATAFAYEHDLVRDAGD